MPIFVRNIKFYQITGKGHVLETSIQSANISQLEGDVLSFLKNEGLDAQSKVGKDSLEIKNIKRFKDGKRAPGWVYAKLRQMIATNLEQRHMRGSVTGSS
jgi:ribosomal protein L39E